MKAKTISQFVFALLFAVVCFSACQTGSELETAVAEEESALSGQPTPLCGVDGNNMQGLDQCETSCECPMAATAVDGLMSEWAGAQEKTLDDAIELCSKISDIFDWEDEDLNGLGDDRAVNCKDFSKWWRECMIRTGYPDVGILGVWCKNCDSGSSRGHDVNDYFDAAQNKWCVHEPQRSHDQTVYGQCCRANRDDARQCALDTYCTNAANHRDPCCESKNWTDRTAKDCKESCRWERTIEGETYLICGDIPGVSLPGSPPVAPLFPKPPSEPPTKCEEAQKKCIEQHGAAAGDNSTTICANCKKADIPECYDIDGDGVHNDDDKCDKSDQAPKPCDIHDDPNSPFYGCCANKDEITG